MTTRTNAARGASLPIIGLTGTVGSGKSTVAAMLRDLGCVVSDSDVLARAALDDPEVIDALRDRWGAHPFDEEGRPRRDAIAAIVFADAQERQFLESIVHPWIERRRREQFAAAPSSAPALVIDAPLLLEAGLANACDQVWVVDAPRDIRLARVAASRGWDDAELARRERSQWPASRKRAAADVLIENGGTLERLAVGVSAALRGVRSAESTGS